MTLTLPAALWGLVLLPLYAWVRLHRFRPREVPVSSLLLWARLPEDAGAARASRRRQAARLLLELLALLLTLLAAAAPRLPLAPAPRESLVVLDRSLSMSTRDENGRTRWNEALDRLDAWTAPRGSDDRLLVLLPGARGDAESVDGEPGAVLARLRGLSPLDCAAPLPDALARARALLAASATSRLLVLAAREPAVQPAAPGEREACSLVGGPSHNRAIVSFGVAALEKGRLRVEARVKNFAGASSACRLRMDAEGGPVLAEVPVALAAGGSQWLSLEVDAPVSERLRAELQPADELPQDDHVEACLRPVRGPRIALVGTAEPALEKALAVAAGDPPVRVPEGETPAPGRFELVVFAGCLPRVLPGLPAALVSPPPGVFGPGVVEPARDVSALTRIAEDDPLLRHVDLRRVRFRRASTLGSLPDAPPPRVLAAADGSPFLALWETTPARPLPLLVVGVDLAASGDAGATDWPLLPEFALFWDNVVHALTGPRLGPYARTGDTVRLAAARWPAPRVLGPGQVEVATGDAGGAAAFVPLRAGTYEIRSSGRSEVLPVNVLDPEASDNRGVHGPPPPPFAAAASGSGLAVAPALFLAAATALAASLALERTGRAARA
ncbi:MAG: BatA domain-containing protein [Planctomycetes bacterium]|nr:BatA domain-containing protein [Planctomycetota bacterium]